MNSRIAKILGALVLGTVIAGAAYWAGYANGGNAAESGAATKKSAATGKNITLVAKGGAGANETLGGFLGGAPHPDTEALDRWAKSLSLQECLDNMKQLQDLPVGEPRDDILKALVNAWAKKDPKGLLAGSAGIQAPKLRENGVENALKQLGASNPKETLDWIKQNSDNASNADVARRMAQLMNGYATVDPVGAINAVLALGDGTPNDRQVQTKAIEGLADGLATQGKFADAVALFNQLPSGKLQNDALSQLVDNWAVIAPQNAAGYIATVQDPKLVNDLGQSLTDVWSATDPAAAAKWAAQMDAQAPAAGATGNGNNADSLLSNAIDVWSKYDLNTAGQFLNQLPPSASKDAAIASFVSRAAQDDPVAALKWVATMGDTKLQASAFMQAAKQWNKQDPAALNQFLATTTALTDAQKQAVAAALQKINGNSGN